jgi:hypothetical protein
VYRKNAVNAHVPIPVFQCGFSVAVIINIKGIVEACWNHDGIFSVAVTNTHIWGIRKPDARQQQRRGKGVAVKIRDPSMQAGVRADDLLLVFPFLRLDLYKDISRQSCHFFYDTF